MAEVTASAVAQLRKRTNAGLMDCKKALIEAEGNADLAAEILRKKGIATAVKKEGREATEGRVAIATSDDNRIGAIVEINCETDFVAKNDTFEAFCNQVADKLVVDINADVEEDRTNAVAKIGENIQYGRKDRFTVEDGVGFVTGYIHTGAKVGVMLQMKAGSDATISSDEFQQLCRDLTLQIAAASPEAVDRSGIDTSVIEKEKEIVAEQMKDKPAAAIERIITGKLEKFYQVNCLVDQGFVKANGEVSVSQHIAETGKKLGDDSIAPVRFARIQIGQ